MPTFQQTYKTITKSELFQQFKQEHPEAKLCAGFFILDFLSNDTKNSLDYLDENTVKVFTFDLADDGFIKLKQDKLVCEEDSNQPKLTPLQQLTPKIEVIPDTLIFVPNVNVDFEFLESDSVVDLTIFKDLTLPKEFGRQRPFEPY